MSSWELVLDGPGKNALSTAMLQSMLERLDAHPGRPFLLRGENGALSAGVDLKEIATKSAGEMPAYLELLDAVARRIFEWPAPTVAVLDGHAIAGGAVFALCCDQRIAQDDERLRIGLTEVAVGVMFPPRIWKMMTSRIAANQRPRVLLGAALVPPREACRLGLVDEVVPAALDAGRARLAQLAAYDPEVYRRTKAMLVAGVTDVTEDEHQRFLDEVVPAWSSPELRARLAARLAPRRRA